MGGAVSHTESFKVAQFCLYYWIPLLHTAATTQERGWVGNFAPTLPPSVLTNFLHFPSDGGEGSYTLIQVERGGLSLDEKRNL